MSRASVRIVCTSGDLQPLPLTAFRNGYVFTPARCFDMIQLRDKFGFLHPAAVTLRICWDATLRQTQRRTHVRQGPSWLVLRFLHAHNYYIWYVFSDESLFGTVLLSRPLRHPTSYRMQNVYYVPWMMYYFVEYLPNAATLQHSLISTKLHLGELLLLLFLLAFARVASAARKHDRRRLCRQVRISCVGFCGYFVVKGSFKVSV